MNIDEYRHLKGLVIIVSYCFYGRKDATQHLHIPTFAATKHFRGDAFSRLQQRRGLGKWLDVWAKQPRLGVAFLAGIHQEIPGLNSWFWWFLASRLINHFLAQYSLFILCWKWALRSSTSFAARMSPTETKLMDVFILTFAEFSLDWKASIKDTETINHLLMFRHLGVSNILNLLWGCREHKSSTCADSCDLHGMESQLVSNGTATKERQYHDNGNPKCPAVVCQAAKASCCGRQILLKYIVNHSDTFLDLFRFQPWLGTFQPWVGTRQCPIPCFEAGNQRPILSSHHGCVRNMVGPTDHPRLHPS